MPAFSQEIHRKIYLFSLLLLSVSIPLSRYMMSIAELILFGNVLLEGNYAQRMKPFLQNRAAVIFSSLFILHLAGLLFTTDFEYAFKDIRTKVPLILLPMVIASAEPLGRKQWEGIILFYLASVFTGSLISTWIWAKGTWTDIRDISPFISHIRFSLNVCLAIIMTLYLSFGREIELRTPSWLGIVLASWFVAFLFIAESLTGLVIMLVLALVMAGIGLSRLKKLWISYLSFIIALIALGFLAHIVIREYRSEFSVRTFDIKQLPQYTAKGGWYVHETRSRQMVNGHPLWLYVCVPEMRDSWNARSEVSFDSLGRSGLPVKDVLTRYLTSRGYTKDADGVNKLNAEEINDIERGIADVRDRNASGLERRLRQVIWELQNYSSTGNASGLSVAMRLEYWKASLFLIRDHWLTGVGTGDMNIAFSRYYEQTHSTLSDEWRRRSHNQYLSVAVGFGLLGLLWFLAAIFMPPAMLNQLRPGPFLFFLLVLAISMLTEDTVESQDGVTFAAFFYSFFLFARHRKSG